MGKPSAVNIEPTLDERAQAIVGDLDKVKAILSELDKLRATPATARPEEQAQFRATEQG